MKKGRKASNIKALKCLILLSSFLTACSPSNEKQMERTSDRPFIRIVMVVLILTSSGNRWCWQRILHPRLKSTWLRLSNLLILP